MLVELRVSRTRRTYYTDLNISLVNAWMSYMLFGAVIPWLEKNVLDEDFSACRETETKRFLDIMAKGKKGMGWRFNPE